MYIIYINILEPSANMGSQLWQLKIALFIYSWVQNYIEENRYNLKVLKIRSERKVQYTF